MRFLLDKMTEADLTKLWNWGACWRRIAYVSAFEFLVLLLTLAMVAVVASGFYNAGKVDTIDPVRISPKHARGACSGFSDQQIKSL